MPPDQEYYLRPTTADRGVAQRWKGIEYVTRWTPEGEIIASFFPCKITTAKGQELFATITLSDITMEIGHIEIPFGIWNKHNVDVGEEVKMFNAQQMQNVALIGRKNMSDFTRYEILGIDKDRSINFDIYPSRCTLEEIGFHSKYGQYQTAKWPSNTLRVEGLVRDFQDDFPGWKIEPIALRPTK